MKVVVEYDPVTGTISDNEGTYIGCWVGLKHFEEGLSNSGVEVLIKLKDAGYTAEEVVQLKMGGLL